MSLRHKSVKTLDNPEFINLEEDAINPGISRCEIKVFYLGQNRNGSYFSKEVAERMAQTLPGAPIVGVWHEDEQDFGDHGERITIENGEVKFECTTRPYGFVAPDTKVWFQDFEDEDDFGNPTIHTYMMANGYLWTGQYPEVASAIEEGKGQSMELGGDMDGHWATDTSKDIDFYIVDDAEFVNLCILGDDVEPCMEGASITAPEPSNNFSVDDFNMSLYRMMKELQNSLEGGSMTEEAKNAEVEEEPTPLFSDKEDEKKEEDFAKKEQDDDADEPAPASDDDDSQTDDDDSASDDADDSDDKKKPSNKNSLEERNEELESQLADVTAKFNDVVSKMDELQGKFEALEEEAGALKAFRDARVRADKDALIAKYHMLSDEDKADVVAHEDEYTLEEIESKLALAYVKANVDFDTVDGKPDVEGDATTTFSLDVNVNGEQDVDPMVDALREASLNW